MPMVTKFVRVVTYGEELPPIHSHDTSIRWSCGVTWQVKYIMSLLPEDICSPTEARCWLTQDFCPLNLARCWLRGRRFSTETLKLSPTSCYITGQKLRYFAFAWDFSSAINFIEKRLRHRCLCILENFKAHLYFRTSYLILVSIILFPDIHLLFFKQLGSDHRPQRFFF